MERTGGTGDVAPPSLIAVVTDDDVVVVVEDDAGGVDAEADVPFELEDEDDEALRSSALSERFSVFLTGAGPAGEAEPDWFVEKATLLKMAPRVLSMELGLSPREKTGRSSKDKP